MVGLSGGPGGAGPLFYVAHALAPTSTFSLAHWGEIMGAAVDSLATGTRGGCYIISWQEQCRCIVVYSDTPRLL